MDNTNEDEKYMRMALREAQKAFDEKEIPIGCVIVKDSVVIGRGHNQIEMLKDATAHAEILSIGTASGKLENWRLDGATLYVTLEPCPMCAGAIMSARISRLVYGATDAREGAVESIFNIPGHPSLAPSPIITAGVMEDECKALLQSFFAARR